MQDKFGKIMEKKKDGKEMDPMHKEAKMSMLKALKDEMSKMMKDDISGGPMKKVEVAAPNSKGLVAGLDKAKDLLGAADHHSNDDEDAEDMGHDEGVENDHDKMLHKAYGDMGLMGDDEDKDEDAEEGDDMEMPEHDEPAEHSDMSDEEMDQLQMLLDKMKKAKMSKKF